MAKFNQFFLISFAEEIFSYDRTGRVKRTLVMINDKLITVFLLITFTAKSLQLTVLCEYQNSSMVSNGLLVWKIVEDPYAFIVMTLDIKSKLNVTNVTGNHADGYTNSDVKALKIIGGEVISSDRNTNNDEIRNSCHIIPSELGSIFPNVEALLVWNASLKHVSSSDLQQFSNLKEIWLHDNDLDYLESNLFEYNLEVEIVVVKGNKIKYVGRTFFLICCLIYLK